MYLDRRLPNDLLNNPPWPETIATMPIHGALIEALDEINHELRAFGYSLVYGIEANLQTLTGKEAVQWDDSALGWRRAAREQFLRDRDRIGRLQPTTAPFTEIYQRLQSLAATRSDQHHRNPHPDTAQWLKNWELAQSYYQKAHSSFETSDVIMARKNLMLAAVHLLPQTLGGLDGIIEQKYFSGEKFGGWWDEGIIEVRTMPVRGHEDAISNFHEVLWKLKNAIEFVQQIPIAHIGFAQVHFSLWRNKDNVNLFTLQDPESLNMQVRLAEHLRERLLTNAVQYPSLMRNPRLFDAGEPGVSTSRTSAIRICENSWELRIDHESGVTHVPRDIYIIASSIRDFFRLHTPGYKPAIPRTTNIEPGIRELVNPAKFGGNPVRLVKKLVIESAVPRVNCPFKSCLENGFVNDKGGIEVPFSTLAWNEEVLADVTLHIARSRELAVDTGLLDLEDTMLWRELFRSLKVSDNGEIDTSNVIHPALAQPFIGLRVAEIKLGPHGGEIGAYTTKDAALYNRVTNHWMAEGKMDAAGQPLSPAERTVYTFLRDRAGVFDPENAVKYLKQLYYKNSVEVCTDEEQIRDEAGVAVRHLLNDTMGAWIEQKLAYPDKFATQEDVFPEHAALAHIQSLRTALVYAMPEIEDGVGSGNFSLFYRTMVELVADPKNLYTPFNMSFLLRRSLFDFEEEHDALIDTTKELDTATARKYCFDNPREVGAMVVRLAAADQYDDAQTTKILNSFIASAEMISRPSQTRVLKAVGETTIFEKNREGLASGIVEESTSLLADRSPLLRLRAQAKERLES